MDLDDEELKATRRMNGSDKDVGSKKKDIKILEELRKELELYADGNKIRQGLALEHLLKAYKESKEENKKWEKYCTEDLEKQITELNNKIFELEHNSISVSLVEEKIEELKNAKKSIDKENWKYIYQMQINILQELLEKRK